MSSPGFRGYYQDLELSSYKWLQFVFLSWVVDCAPQVKQQAAHGVKIAAVGTGAYMVVYRRVDLAANQPAPEDSMVPAELAAEVSADTREDINTCTWHMAHDTRDMTHDAQHDT